jgi:hypothetical protein
MCVEGRCEEEGDTLFALTLTLGWERLLGVSGLLCELQTSAILISAISLSHIPWGGFKTTLWQSMFWELGSAFPPPKLARRGTALTDLVLTGDNVMFLLTKRLNTFCLVCGNNCSWSPELSTSGHQAKRKAKPPEESLVNSASVVWPRSHSNPGTRHVGKEASRWI